MRRISFTLTLPLLLTSLLLVLPITVQAKVAKKRVIRHWSISAIPGKDEKSFKNPTTRCLTKDMKQMNDQAVRQMEKDVQKLGVGHEDAVKTYQEKMNTIWAAMFEPYCGYGSRGLRAVRGSFMKSVNKTRAQFLAAIKLPPLVHVSSTSTTTLVNTTVTTTSSTQ